MDLQCRDVTLPEIATVERAVNGKTYPTGTVYIQVSACRRSNLEQFKKLEKESAIESKYAVINPIVPALPDYLQITLERSAREFMERFVGTNINIQMEAFNCFSMKWHDDILDQKFVVDALKPIELSIKSVKKEIEAVQLAKRYFLGTMFPKL